MILNQILSDQSDIISRHTALATKEQDPWKYLVIVFWEWLQQNPFCVVFTLIQGSVLAI